MWIFLGTIIVFFTIFTESSTASGPTGSKAMAVLRKDLLRDYDPLSRPCSSNSENTTVQVGITLTSIMELNEKESLFHFDSFVKMSWNDLSLRWDPASYDGIAILHIPPNEIWTPDLAVYQGHGGDLPFIKSDAYLLVYNNGKILWVPPLTIRSLCKYDYERFPKDRQTCRVSFGSWTHSGFKIDLQADSRQEPNSLHDDNPNWKFEEMTVEREAKYYPCCPEEPYITINFNITVSRLGYEGEVATSLVRNALLVLVLAMFWVPATDGGKKILPGLVALIGQIGLLVLTTLLAPSLKALPYAVFPLKISAVFTTAAILVELLVLSVVNFSSDCPPLTALGSMLNSKAIKILVVNSCRPNHDRDAMTKSAITDGKSGDFKNWPLVATLIDRICFLIFAILFVVTLAIW